MPLIDLPVGVVATPTNAKNSANWRSSHLIRWSGMLMQPIGGWEQVSYPDTNTNIRAVHQWRDLNGRLWTAYLTEDDIFVDDGGVLVSIAPDPVMAPLEGDGVEGGYGDGTYSAGTYGTPRADHPPRLVIGPAYSLDNWGENLLIMTSVDGRLLQWEPSSPPAASVVVENAPTGNRSFVVTPERYVIVFGPSGGYDFRWCDTEDITVWTEAVDNTSGELPVSPAAPFVAAIHDGIESLMATTRAWYRIPYQGLPYIFGVFEIGEGGIPISPQSIKKLSNGAIWPSESGMWIYNGSSLLPVACDVWPWVKENIDMNKARSIAAAVVLEGVSEYWFMFPSVGSDFNNMVAVYNYRDGWWAQHLLSRSAGFASSYSEFPIIADRKKVYQHESGMLYGGTVQPFAETFSINNSGGVATGVIKQIEPEIDGDFANLRFSLAYRFNRTAQVDKYTPQRKVQPNGFVDFDQSGRDFRLRVDALVGNTGWTLGPAFVDLKSGGRQP